MIGLGDCQCAAIGGALRDGGGGNQRFGDRKILLQIGIWIIRDCRGLQIEHADRCRRCLSSPVALHQLSVEKENQRVDIAAAQLDRSRGNPVSQVIFLQAPAARQDPGAAAATPVVTVGKPPSGCACASCEVG